MMNIDNPELSKRLRERDLRPTEARRLILALLSEENGHLNTDGIIKTLRDKGYPLSIATLYQNLEKLVEAGLLIRLKGPDGVMRFDANLEPHHHLVCVTCGRMADVKMNRETLSKHSAIDFHTGLDFSDWHIHHIKIEYQGTCPNCQK